jgi:hypothetical protein
MVTELINEFRRQNGVGPFYHWNGVENYYCELHCLHMERARCEHAPDWLLCHRGEAVAAWPWDWDLKHTVSKMIWDSKDGFINSPGHKRILLMSNLAYGVQVNNGMVYLTIRGW